MKLYSKVLSVLMLFSALTLSGCASDGESSGGDSSLTAPGAATVTADNGILALTWTAVQDAASYEVWYSTTNSTSTPTPIQQGGDITATSYSITGLTNGTTYYVWLKAKSAAGISEFGTVTSGTPVIPLPPIAPGAAIATPGNGQLSLSWTAVSTATSYEVWADSTDNPGTASQHGGVITDLNYTITGITGGTWYVWLKAKNSAGTSDFGPISSTTGTSVTLTIPDAPGATSITAGNGQLSLSWTAVQGAASYEVWYYTSDNSASASCKISDRSATNYTITGLTNGTPYFVWIKAKNSIGTSGFGTVASGTPVLPAVIPSAPSITTVTLGDGEVLLNWTSVSGATSYEIWYSTPVNSTSTAVKFGTEPAGTSITVTGLTNGAAHYFRVKAKNSIGTSGFSISKGAYPGIFVVTTTDITKISRCNASISGTIIHNGIPAPSSWGVCWSTNINPTISDSKANNPSNSSSFTANLTGLTPSTLYYARAYASNGTDTTYGNQVSFSTNTTYIKGDTGPAGGIVFYDDLADTFDDVPNYRYLEVAPSNQSNAAKWDDGTQVYISGAAGTAVGTGSANTAAIITSRGAHAVAATLCKATLFGFSDWFLPSLEELKLFREYIVDFSDPNNQRFYWSSSDNNTNNAWSLNNWNNTQSSYGKELQLPVRAIRAFN